MERSEHGSVGDTEEMSEGFFSCVEERPSNWTEEQSVSEEEISEGFLSSVEVRPSNWTEVQPTSEWDSSDDKNEDAELKERLIDLLKKDSWVIFDPSLVSIGERLAGGCQGEVYAGSLHLTISPKPLPVVVKKFKLKSLKCVSQGHYPSGLLSVKCTHVCRPRGVFFDKDDHLCMIMKRYSGNLRNVILSEMKLHREKFGENYSGSPFMESVALHIIMQIALGMEGLHGCEICHRDIKTENILVNKNEGYKSNSYAIAIADFESSELVIGTGYWRAPEVMKHIQRRRIPLSKKEWEAADVYSFGMTCYEILTGNDPFHDHPLKSDYDLVLSGKRPELPDHISEPLKNIICSCWHQDPDSRPPFITISQLLREVENNELAVASLDIMKQHRELEEELERLKKDRTLEDERLNMVRTLEYDLDELKVFVSNHVQRFKIDQGTPTDYAYWAFQFFSTVDSKKFKLQLSSFSHPLEQSFRFAEYVERRRLFALIHHQSYMWYSTMQPTQAQIMERLSIQGSYGEEVAKISMLMTKVVAPIAESVKLSKLEKNGLVKISDKEDIIQNFMNSLSSAGMDFKVSLDELYHIVDQMDDNSNKFRILLICGYLWYACGLYKIFGSSVIFFQYFKYLIPGLCVLWHILDLHIPVYSIPL